MLPRVAIVASLLLSACNQPFDFSMAVGNDATASPAHTTSVNGVVLDDVTAIVRHFDDFQDALTAPPIVIDVVPTDGSAPLHHSFDLNYCQEYCGGSGSEACGDVEVLKTTDLEVDVGYGQDGLYLSINIEEMNCSSYGGADFGFAI